MSLKLEIAEHLKDAMRSGDVKRRDAIRLLQAAIKQREIDDRIEMDDAVRLQLSKLLTPRSSITISDNGLSYETGAKATDFIVLTDPKPNKNLEVVAVN